MVKKGLNDFILKPGAAAVRSRYESFANNSQNGRYPLQFSQETKNTVDGHLSQSEQCISTRRQFVVIGVLARRNASSQDHRAQYGHAYKSTKLLENGPDFSFLQTTHTFQKLSPYIIMEPGRTTREQRGGMRDDDTSTGQQWDDPSQGQRGQFVSPPFRSLPPLCGRYS